MYESSHESSLRRHVDGAALHPDSLVDVLRWRAEHEPDRRAYYFLVDGEANEAALTYCELDMRARAIGARLQALGAVGERVMLVCPPGLDYVSAYWGCLYAGAIVVPAYPPRANRTTDTLLAIVRDSGARVALTTAQTGKDVEADFARATDLPVTVLGIESLTEEAAPHWRHPGGRPDSLAFLQYTSGSTGTPKGVMVSHGNLVANMTAAWTAVEMTPESRPFSWLPPFHDMGLISGVIHPIFAGLPGGLMAPAAFIQRPVRWLRAISTYGITHSGGPPFAYDYCLRKITPDQLPGIDLRSWATAYVGAEPIRVDTLEHFAEAYAAVGLRRSAMYPCYGMAETTLMVSGGPRQPRPVAFAADTSALEVGRVVPSAAGSRGDARLLPACGEPLSDTTVVIADPERLTQCPPGESGEIWVSSPAVAHGYWNKPAESEQTFRARLADTGDGPFLRTGDLGFMHDGQVYVTGRHKDLIILKGKNHYPQDVEQTVERCHAALRPAGVAAFAVDQVDQTGGEQLVVVQEVEAAHARTLDADAVLSTIRQAIAEEHDVVPGAIVLIRPGAIPKTSSGKIRRRACREAYLGGSLPVVATWARPGFDPSLEAPSPSPSPVRGRGEDGLPGSPLPRMGEGLGEGAPQPDADEIARWLVAHLAGALQVQANTIDVREPFSRYGLTSVEAVGLSGDLEEWLGRRLSPTLAYDYPSIEALARRLSEGGGGADERMDEEGDGRRRAVRSDEPIAIVGLGCRLPGAESPDALWQLLRDGVDAIGEVPPDRWSLDATYDPDPDASGKIATRYGGFLGRVDGFDADFFRIAAREAVKMDPQQRLVLEVSWEALEDAGQAVDQLVGTRTGVFMGICSADYARLHIGSGDTSEIDAYSGTGVAFSVAIGRISYALGLQGPNLAVDTSCSSSLVAVHLACQSLRSGESDLALAGGVNMMLSPETSIFLSKAHALAPDGRCKTFSAAADGYARGEGCGVVVLKRLADSLEDGDRVLALIRGSAVNHDGRSNGLTAPNGPSQEAVIRAALTQAGVEPSDVSYVEAHGTGTALGDPIEVQALAAVLGQDRPATQPLALGSIKTNVGHLEAAAGVAGLVKTVLALQRGLIPPHLHFDAPSPYIRWAELPVTVPTTLSPWPVGPDGPEGPEGHRRRIAGVSAFGFSGTNAHVVVEEAPSVRPAEVAASPAEPEGYLLPISARSPAALRELAAAYRDLLGPLGTVASLADVCYTASVRRSHHEHRLAVVGRSREELVEKLEAFLVPEESPTPCPPPHCGGEGESDGSLPSPSQSGGAGGGARLSVLSAEYMAGQTPDWRALYPYGGRCVSLPHYPWQRERFWVDARPSAGGTALGSRTVRDGHPLLGEHVELATQADTHVWETNLTADALPYLPDHRVGVLVVLPAAVFVDLALAAAKQATGSDDVSLDTVTIGQALALPEGRAQRLQVVVTSDFPGSPIVRIFSLERDPRAEHGRRDGTRHDRQPSRAAWTLHAEARIVVHAWSNGTGRDAAAATLVRPPSEIAARCPERVDGSTHYAALASRGLEYGPAFRRVVEVWQGRGEALGRLLPGRMPDGCVIDPTLLDACFQVLGPALAGSTAIGADELFLPVGLEHLRLLDWPAADGPLWCHAIARPTTDADLLAGDLYLLDESGRVVLEARGLRVRRLAGHARGEVTPAPAASATERQTMGEAELLEAYLIGLVAKAVGRPAARIERDRPLSDLGLDSLMAMELRNRIAADLGLTVPIATFLQGPSVADLVAALAESETLAAVGTGAAGDGSPSPSAIPASAAAIDGATDGAALPLSHGQRALWLTHQLAPHSTAYHIMFAARLLGGIDGAAMETAVHQLVARHDSLRTTYAVAMDGQPFQQVHAQASGGFGVADAAGLTDDELRARLGAEADRPFDLEHGPLLRVVLFRRSDAEHVLLLAVHHLAVDFWSLEVLVEELRALYEVARTGSQAGQPVMLRVTRQYADFVRWQAERLESPAGDRLWQYWQQKLAGDLPILAFPTDRARPRIQTYRGAVHDFGLDAHLTERLRTLARAEGATLYATLVAAFSALLARYTGQDDLLIGSPMAGRGRADFERTVGYLVNVVPLRADLSDRPTFRQLLQRTRDTVLEALDHQDYPFPLLVERLQPPREPGRSPLVQALFIWYRSALLEAGTGPLDLLAWEQRGAPYDLVLLMTEAHGSLLARLQYNADLFDAETMARVGEHFRRLLEGVILDPDRPVDAVRMLTGAERVQQLVSWNDTQAPYPDTACLHELFEAQARRTPEAVALHWEHERLTYRELNRRANRVARRLRALGVGPEVLVGVCAERTPMLVAGLLGVLKAGGAYVPLDPAYPEARRAYMLQDSGARVLLTQRSLAQALDGHGTAVLCLDEPELLTFGPDDDADALSGATPDNLAYVMYTSGSTGQPKGVMIEHRGPVALAAWAPDAFGPESLAGMLFSTSICFDLSVFELFVPLSCGGAVVMAENVLQLPRLPAAEDVTFVNTVASALAELLREHPLPSSVRVIGFGGEAPPNAVAQDAYRQPQVRACYNLYGPTEDTVYSTWALIERGTATPPPVGKPLANRRIYVLDRHLQPVPVGVPGDVYMAGVGLARGYLNRPDLTAERFVPSPFGDGPGDRLYRVGDVGRFRPDGTLELLGRLDDQVKIRGFRIELGEIEARLRQHPAVREAVVAARNDRQGNPQLAAYLVSDARRAPTPHPPPPCGGEGWGVGASLPTVSELRHFLQRELPDYMVPPAMIWLDQMPRTPNGKVDRRALPDPGSERPDLDAAYVAPRTRAEAQLAAIWADVLEVERVGIHDSFFDLGGASFASVTIAARANEVGLPLTADLLFAYPTIALLSELAEQAAVPVGGGR